MLIFYNFGRQVIVAALLQGLIYYSLTVGPMKTARSDDAILDEGAGLLICE